MIDFFFSLETALPLAIACFLAIVFLQSGVDKILDRQGNLAWLKAHFEKTFLAPTASILLLVVTIFELLTGLIAIWGLYCLIFCGETAFIRHALILALYTLIMLLFGQRIAKDYDGAKTIVIYIIACLVGSMFV